jgi:serine protease Do
MFRRLTLSLMLIVAGFVAGLVVTGRMRTAADSSAAERPAAATPAPRAVAAEPPAAAPVQTAGFSSGGPDFTRVAGMAVKGVANISSLQVVRTRNSPFPNDPFFRYFFGDDEQFGSRDRRSMSLGSGVIISADGYVVTNNHVVGEHVREITIALPDKREVKGKVIGTDPTTDIALLKIPATGLPVIAWGDSSQLKVGEWVLAIGSPFQLSQTVTAGIVSATGRANMGFADYEDFIQTDAAINPGNSGGALINARGELVGINTGIYSESGGYQGIGFAVPSKLARHVVDDLMQYGEVRRGSIGPLGIEKLTPQLAEEVGVTATTGALVSRMTRASEAFDAGLRPGDVIIAMNGQAIGDPSQFLRLVADSKPGTIAIVKVLRASRTLEFKLPIVSTSTARVRG